MLNNEQIAYKFCLRVKTINVAINEFAILFSGNSKKSLIRYSFEVFVDRHDGINCGDVVETQCVSQSDAVDAAYCAAN